MSSSFQTVIRSDIFQTYCQTRHSMTTYGKWPVLKISSLTLLSVPQFQRFLHPSPPSGLKLQLADFYRRSGISPCPEDMRPQRYSNFPNSQKCRMILFFHTICNTFATQFTCLPTRQSNARMAESVDALVSNTNVRKDVPVRPRLRVPQKLTNQTISKFYCFYGQQKARAVLYQDRPSCQVCILPQI